MTHWLLPENPNSLTGTNLHPDFRNRLNSNGIDTAWHYHGQHPALAILDILIKNYTNNTTNDRRITSTYTHFTQTDPISMVANYIARGCADRTSELNHFNFIEKTRFSGVQITEVISSVERQLTDNQTLEELPAISVFLQTKEIKIRVYKYKKDNTTIYYILTNKINQRTIATLIGMVPKFFPHVFDNLQEKEKTILIDLFTAIGTMEVENIEEALTKALAELKEPKLPEVPFEEILKLTQQRLDTKLETLRTTLTSKQNAQRDLLLSYADLQNTIQDLVAQIKGLMSIETKDESKELLDLVKSFKSIIGYIAIPEVSRTDKALVIRSKLIPSDPELAEKIFSNATKASNYNVHQPNARTLLYRLLATQEYTLDFCTGFIYRKQSTSYPRIIYDHLPILYTRNTIPNPHLSYHTCFGGNGPLIANALVEGDIPKLLGITTACNSDLNIGDPTVLREFCRDLFDTYYDRPIIYVKSTKTYKTPKEILAEIRKEQTDETV